MLRWERCANLVARWPYALQLASILLQLFRDISLDIREISLRDAYKEVAEPNLERYDPTSS